MRIINRQEVERLLPMAACIDVMADAMHAASGGAVSMPLRLFTPLADGSGSFRRGFPPFKVTYRFSITKPAGRSR
jgi:ornithine cyclodeaminase/alanine dehydrogenase-like protein (mu-crystallin family)